VVVVSVTHRLNVFGYLYLGAVAGDGYASSGAVGHLDLVLALEWVRANIARFGGDPDNVTIFGESAGGAKCAWLMTMPEARGLFHKAVIQSGADTTTGLSTTLSHAEEFTDVFLTELGLHKTAWRRLLEQPAERLVAAHEAAAAKLRIPYVLPPPGPTVDGAVLAETPVEAVEKGRVARVPLMIGACADELQLFTMRRDYLADTPGEERRAEIGDSGPTPLSPSGFEALRRWLGEGGDAVIEAYSRGRPDAAADEIEAAIRGDRQFLIPSLRFAEPHLKNGDGPVFVYSFGWKSGLVPQLGAFHSLDIPFFFDRTAAVPIAHRDPTAADVSGRMSDALIAFARTGSPNHPGTPEWPGYDVTTRPTMIFDRECRVENDPRSADRSAWDSIPTSRLGF
jgi:para-nitrobenzyl esterase